MLRAEEPEACAHQGPCCGIELAVYQQHSHQHGRHCNHPRDLYGHIRRPAWRDWLNLQGLVQ